MSTGGDALFANLGIINAPNTISNQRKCRVKLGPIATGSMSFVNLQGVESHEEIRIDGRGSVPDHGRCGS